MGLGTTHGCWHEPYSSFYQWRYLLKEVANIPPEHLRPDVLYMLLNHSDCEGDIPSALCGLIADRLEELLPLMAEEPGPGGDRYQRLTQQFIDGLRLAAKLGEDVEFN